MGKGYESIGLSECLTAFRVDTDSVMAYTLEASAQVHRRKLASGGGVESKRHGGQRVAMSYVWLLRRETL